MLEEQLATSGRDVEEVRMCDDQTFDARTHTVDWSQALRFIYLLDMHKQRQSPIHKYK